MKLFFAKYLPSKGNLKKGGKHISATQESVEHHIFTTSDDVSKKEADLMGLTKVKLYLCSRDIPYGGGIRLYRNPEKEYISMSRDTDGGRINLHSIEKDGEYKHGPSPKFEECFKVIGEISREATWVTEEMEFDKDDVKKQIVVECYYQNREVQYQTETRLIKAIERYLPKDHETILNEIILIKGCCGHYH